MEAPAASLTNRAVSRNTPLVAPAQVLRRSRSPYLSARSHCPCVPCVCRWCVLCGRRVHEASSLCVPSTLLPRTKAHGDRTVIVPVTLRIRVTLLCKRRCASLHLAAPPRSSPSLPLSVCCPSSPSSSSRCSCREVLESAVRTAVAALDREIQHLEEYRNNGASLPPAAPSMAAPAVLQHTQKIIRPQLHPCARALPTCCQHPSSTILPPSSCIRPPSISCGGILSLPLLLLPCSLFQGLIHSGGVLESPE